MTEPGSAQAWIVPNLQMYRSTFQEKGGIVKDSTFQGKGGMVNTEYYLQEKGRHGKCRLVLLVKGRHGQ